MTDLDDAQLELLRRRHGRAEPKELAQALGLPRKRVEDALAALPLPPWKGREHPALALVLALVLLALGGLAYGNNDAAPMHFDDVHAIQNNDAIRTLHRRYTETTRATDSPLHRFQSFRAALAPTAEAIYDFNLYRMVTYWSFALTYFDHPLDEARRAGPEAHAAALAGWHRANDRIHLLNGLLAFWVAWLTLTAPAFRRALRATPWPLLVSFVAALVFVLHPMQVQAVTYLTQRTESLCATFYLLSLGLYATARRRGLGPVRGEAPWLSPLVCGAAGAVVVLAAVVAAKSDLLDLPAFVRLAGLSAVACVAGLVALVKTGKDEPVHAACTFGSFLAFALALQTKEIAATIPLAIFAWDLLFVPSDELSPAPTRAPGGPLGRAWLGRALGAHGALRMRYLGPWGAIVAGVAVLAVVFGGANIASQLLSEGVEEGGAVAGRELSAGGYFLTQANVLHTYVRLTVLPTRLHLDHDYPIAGGLGAGATWLALLSLLAVAGAVALALVHGHRARVAAFALLMGLAVLAPTSSVIVLPDVIYEHRFYLPMFGAALVAAVALERALRLRLGERAWPALAGAALLLALPLVAGTRARNAVWSSELALWRDVTEKSPGKPRAWTNLGLAYQNSEPFAIQWGDRRLEGLPVELPDGGTLVHSTVAMGQPPLYIPPRQRFSAAAREGGLDLAIAAYDRALAMDPDYDKALNNAALCHVSRALVARRQAEALEQLAFVARGQGQDALAATCEAQLREQVAQAAASNAEAARLLEHVIARGPDQPIALSNLANLYIGALNDHELDTKGTWTHLERGVDRLRRALELGAPAPGQATLADALTLLGALRYEAARRAGGPPPLEAARAAWEEAARTCERYLGGVDKQFQERVRGRFEQLQRYLSGAESPPADSRKVLEPPGKQAPRAPRRP